MHIQSSVRQIHPKNYIQFWYQIWNFPNILLLLFLYSFGFRYFISIILEGKYPINSMFVSFAHFLDVKFWIVEKKNSSVESSTGRIVKTTISPVLRVSTIWYWPAEFREGACSIVVTDTRVFTLGWGASDNGQGG